MSNDSLNQLLQISDRYGVICYGAGRFLKTVVSQIEIYGIRLSFIVDKSPDKNGSSFEKYRVYSAEILERDEYAGYAILISSKTYADEIEREILKKYGSKYSIFRYPLSVDRDIDSELLNWENRIVKPCERMYSTLGNLNEIERERLVEKIRNGELVIPRLPIMITTYCTLKCKECSNLIPYFKVKRNFDRDSIIRWINNLLSVVTEIIVLELVGGEPFLYNSLKDLIVTLISYPNIRKIEITTNGSVIPQNEVLEALSNEKIYISISEYPGVIDNTEFIKALNRYSIKYNVMSEMRWIKTGKLISRDRSKEELKKQYDACGPAKYCRTILNGKMFICSKAASLYEIGVTDEIKYVDLTDATRIDGNIVKNFILDADVTACNYCDMFSNDEQTVLPAEQLKN